MNEGAQTIIYPVKDLDKAKALFTALFGVAPESDTPYYVGWNVAGQDVGLDPNGHAQGLSGPVPYWHVDDIARSVQALVAAGGEVLQDAKDVGGGKLIAWVKDADGDVIGLLSAGLSVRFTIHGHAGGAPATGGSIAGRAHRRHAREAET